MKEIVSKSGVWEFGKEFKDKWFKESAEGCYTSKAFGGRIRAAKTAKGWVVQMDLGGWKTPKFLEPSYKTAKAGIAALEKAFIEAGKKASA